VKKSAVILGIVFLAWVSCMCGFAKAATLPFDSVTVERMVLPRPPADKKISWLVHRGGWGDSPAHGSRLDLRDHDEFIHDFSEGVMAEYKLLSKLGPEAVFIQDFGDVRKLADAAARSGMGYALVETLSPMALESQNIRSKDDCIEFLKRRISVHDEFPGYYSIDGQLMVFLFDISGFTSDEWAEIFRETRRAFPKEELLFIAQRSVFHVMNMPDSVAYMKDTLTVFDGIMFWGGPQDAKEKNLEFAREAIREIGRGKKIFWVLTNGYLRPEKGMFMDPRNTGVWRDQLELCFQNQFDGIIVESWNDLEENTHVKPSREMGGLFFELLTYYSAITNDREYVADAPGLILTHPREILLGEILTIEMISLPVAKPRTRFQIQIETVQGEVIGRLPAQSLTSDSAEVFSFSLPTRELGAHRYLVYRVMTEDRSIQTGTWTAIRKSKHMSPWIQAVALSDVMDSSGVEFDLWDDGEVHRARVKATHPIPLSRVDLYRNNKPVWSMDAEEMAREREWHDQPISLELDFQIPRIYADQSTNRRGTITIENGQWVRGYDALGRDIVESPEQVEWTSIPGRQWNLKLLADASDETRFIVELSALEQTYTFTLGELRRAGIIEQMTSRHGRVWIREVNHPVAWQVREGGLGTNIHAEVSLRLPRRQVESEYFLWMRDHEDHVFRSLPVTICSAERIQVSESWFWDAERDERFSAPVYHDEQVDLVWSFDGPEARVYPDEKGAGVLAKLGGGTFRMGHFNPDAIPGVVHTEHGKALQFKGKEYVQIESGSFPTGAFRVEMEVLPEKIGSAQTLFYYRSNLEIFLRPDGRIGLDLYLGRDRPRAERMHPAPLDPQNWNQISVRFDYQEVTVTVNGQPHAIPFPGPLDPAARISSEGYLGARVGGTDHTSANRFFEGRIGSVRILGTAPVSGDRHRDDLVPSEDPAR